MKYIANSIDSKDLVSDLTLDFVSNKAKGGISKRVFQENKTRQIFQKTNISYPLIRASTF